MTRKGFEPLTFGFVDRRSIQLNYRVNLHTQQRRSSRVTADIVLVGGSATSFPYYVGSSRVL